MSATWRIMPRSHFGSRRWFWFSQSRESHLSRGSRATASPVASIQNRESRTQNRGPQAVLEIENRDVAVLATSVHYENHTPNHRQEPK